MHLFILRLQHKRVSVRTLGMFQLSCDIIRLCLRISCWLFCCCKEKELLSNLFITLKCWSRSYALDFPLSFFYSYLSLDNFFIELCHILKTICSKNRGNRKKWMIFNWNPLRRVDKRIWLTQAQGNERRNFSTTCFSERYNLLYCAIYAWSQCLCLKLRAFNALPQLFSYINFV